MSTPGLLRPAGVGFALAFVLGAVWYGLRELTGAAVYGFELVCALTIALGMRGVTTRRDVRVRVFAAALTYLTTVLAIVPVFVPTVAEELAGYSNRSPGAGDYAWATSFSCLAPVLLGSDSTAVPLAPLGLTLLACATAAFVVGREKRP